MLLSLAWPIVTVPVDSDIRTGPGAIEGCSDKNFAVFVANLETSAEVTSSWAGQSLQGWPRSPRRARTVLASRMGAPAKVLRCVGNERYLGIPEKGLRSGVLESVNRQGWVAPESGIDLVCGGWLVVACRGSISKVSRGPCGFLMLTLWLP